MQCQAQQFAILLSFLFSQTHPKYNTSARLFCHKSLIAHFSYAHWDRSIPCHYAIASILLRAYASVVARKALEARLAPPARRFNGFMIVRAFIQVPGCSVRPIPFDIRLTLINTRLIRAYANPSPTFPRCTAYVHNLVLTTQNIQLSRFNHDYSLFRLPIIIK